MTGQTQNMTILLLGPLPIRDDAVLPRIQTGPLSLSERPLRRGEAGPRASKLQGELQELGYFPLTQTPPYFGMSTDAAVRNFQRAYGLIPDGIVGPTTQAALDEALFRLRTTGVKRPATYAVRKGDSVLRIAQALLGDSSRWREIVEFNQLRDPSRIVPGMILKIPHY